MAPTAAPKVWDPVTDALRIAAELVNGSKHAVVTAALVTQYEWPVRRINSAVTHLSMRRLVRDSEEISHPMVRSWISATPATRRFVQSRSGL